jgi:FtsP/CotA-like multicopper oxidase with cupredoxin domain
VVPGGLARLRLVNGANGRFFNLRVPGRKLRVIGTDGGLLPVPYDVETLVMAPGERYDVMFVVTEDEGAEIQLIDEPYERGHESGTRPATEFARLRVGAGPRVAAKSAPQAGPAIERLPDTDQTIPLRLNEVLRGEHFVFTINGNTMESVPPANVPLGALRVLDLVNESDMDHPFHLHGFFFQVLATNGVATPPSALANKDTIIVKPKQALRLVARFDEPGRWMCHCHILEHGEHGMMAEIVVK